MRGTGKGAGPLVRKEHSLGWPDYILNCAGKSNLERRQGIDETIRGWL